MPVIVGVALGGALGASARYGLDRLIATPSTFPWSTFVVNVTGCFLIGVCASALQSSPDWLRAGVIVGAIGGYTTFSTFALQAYDTRLAVAAVYVVASVAVGIAAVAAGRALA
jgi:CrcB protein